MVWQQALLPLGNLVGPPPYSLRQSSSHIWSSPFWLDWLVNRLSRSSCLCAPLPQNCPVTSRVSMSAGIELNFSWLHSEHFTILLSPPNPQSSITPCEVKGIWEPLILGIWSYTNVTPMCTSISRGKPAFWVGIRWILFQECMVPPYPLCNCPLDSTLGSTASVCNLRKSISEPTQFIVSTDCF